jgi:uncharacterized protein DUF998
MSQNVMTRPAVARPACDPATRVTKSLLGYGVLAGPFYVLVVLGQALLRPGFSLVHDDASLLSNGSFGWVQVLNFVLTGSMAVAFAVGVARALGRGRGAAWGPRLLGVFGLGLIAAGFFVADPMDGFPAGAPQGHPAVASVHGMLHIAAAGVAFAGLIAACFVIAARFSSMRQRRWAASSRTTGTLFLAGFLGLASGSGSPLVVIGFWAALLVAWGWLASLAVTLYRRAAAPARPA